MSLQPSFEFGQVMCCKPFGETQVQLNVIHTSQKTLRDLVDGPFSVLHRMYTLYLQKWIFVCNIVFMCVMMDLYLLEYVCWQQWVMPAVLGLCLQQANKGGVVYVNAKIASVKYDCV